MSRLILFPEVKLNSNFGRLIKAEIICTSVGASTW